MKKALIFLCLCMVMACEKGVQPGTTGATLSGDKADVAEALIRRVFPPEANRSNWPKVYCLGVFPFMDLDQNFLNRFRDIAGVDILPLGQCTTTNAGTLVRKSDQAPAVFFEVDSIPFISPDSAMGAAGFVCGNLCGQGCEYGLKKVAGKWNVVSQGVCWISYLIRKMMLMVA